MNGQAYLESTDVVDWKHPSVRALATRLAAAHTSQADIAQACFEWVRDEIRHSLDCGSDMVTVTASDVLRERIGWCAAQSNLLAALLRANGVPAGFCYQRLRRSHGSGYVLHGLNAVLLPGVGWYRMDARGNKPGVDARFTPPAERLAFSATEPGECDLPEVWAEPLPQVVKCLKCSNGWKEVQRNLPDVELIAGVYGAGREAGH
ncbi:MAG: Cro/Cl family transcriptional regulator [Chitinivibrionales bacterium]|nr:Cro/Cl family transcriptional regulator [Chitinivibrionales bacterium]